MMRVVFIVCCPPWLRTGWIFPAKLRAQSATRATVRINFDPIFFNVERRAASFIHADPVIFAKLWSDLVWASGFMSGQRFIVERAGGFHDENRNAGLGGCPHHRFCGFGKMQRVDRQYGFYAQASHNGFDVDLRFIETEMRYVHAGMGLMTGHARRAVIQDHQQKIMAVEHGAGQWRKTAVEKGGIADEGDNFFSGCSGEAAVVPSPAPMAMRKSPMLSGACRPRV